jgi:hypothetical protein
MDVWKDPGWPKGRFAGPFQVRRRGWGVTGRGKGAILLKAATMDGALWGYWCNKATDRPPEARAMGKN